MRWPGWSYAEPGTGLGPGCRFGDVPDGKQERAPQPLGDPRRIFFYFTYHRQRRSPWRWASLNLTAHPKSEDTGGGKDHAFAVVRKPTSLNNLQAQTPAKAVQSGGGTCTSTLPHNTSCNHPLGVGALSNPLCPYFCVL